jgi:hypothetical protein
VICSEKVYKSYFNKWNFTKNKRADKTGMHRIRQQHLVTRKVPSPKRSEKHAPFDEALGRDRTRCNLAEPIQIELQATFRRRSGRTSPANTPRYIQPPGTLVLEELLSYCMEGQTFSPEVRSKEMYHISTDLTMAQLLFLRGSHKLGGAYCERAFKSLHLLAIPSSNPNLFVFLTTQVMCGNSALTREAWKYLAGYTKIKFGTNYPLQRLFQGFNDYIEVHGFESYLDLAKDRVSNELLRHKRYAAEYFPFFPTHYLDTIGLELPLAKQSRAYKLMKSFRCALQDNIEFSSEDSPAGTLIAANWNRLIRLYAIGDETNWKNDNVLKGAIDLLKQALLCGTDGSYFEAAALITIARFNRAQWDGLMARSHPRHELARFYLEKAIEISIRNQDEVNSSLMENLEVLEQWYREAGEVSRAEETCLKRQYWMQEHSLIVRDNL